MTNREKQQAIIEEVTKYVIAALAVIGGKAPEDVNLDGTILEAVGGDIEKAKQVFYVTEDNFEMELPVDEEQFIHEFNQLEDFISFFTFGLFKREGLENN